MIGNVVDLTPTYSWDQLSNNVMPDGAPPYTLVAAGHRDTGAGGDDAILQVNRSVSTGNNFIGLVCTNDGALQLHSRAGGAGTLVIDSLAAAATEGTWYFWGGGRDTDDAYRIWGNAVNGSGSTNVPTVPTALTGYSVGGFFNGVSSLNGTMLYAGVYDAYLNDDEEAALGAGVWPLLVRPQNLVALTIFIGTTPIDIITGVGYTARTGGSIAVTDSQLAPILPSAQILQFPSAAAAAPARRVFTFT